MSQAKLSECVILLHGLARTSRSMQVMDQALTAAGYQTYNCSYPSRDHAIELLSEKFIPQAIEYCNNRYQPERLHFVSHSLGGILIRFYLEKVKPLNLGRVVMLAPPNYGSELVDYLSRFQLFKLINGPAGDQLGTDPGSLPRSLGAVDYECGIIAGNKSVNPITSSLIPGEDDGKVSTASTQVNGMTDYLVVPHSHTFIMSRKLVIEQTINFLRYGAFQHEEDRF